jgi:hypothetical protein
MRLQIAEQLGKILCMQAPQDEKGSRTWRLSDGYDLLYPGIDLPDCRACCRCSTEVIDASM